MIYFVRWYRNLRLYFEIVSQQENKEYDYGSYDGWGYDRKL